MNQQPVATHARLHPVMMGAAASVILVSLVGVAAITGMIPASHGSAAPTVRNESPIAPLAAAATGTVAAPVSVSPTRYVTPDGRLLDVDPGASQITPRPQIKITQQEAPATRVPELQHNVSHRKVVHHHTQQSFDTQHQDYARNSYTEPAQQQPQPQSYYAPQQRPVQSYVSDMHPVGTDVGAVVGGLLGNQVGGGNGKKLATIAGVLMGGYAGNEVAHNRNPLP